MGESKEPSPSTLLAFRYMALFAGWSLALFAVTRLSWVERHLMLPLAALQQRLSAVLAGPAARAVFVDASCTGTDVLALCTGAILAYPAPWPARLRGLALALAAILGLNVLRLGSVSLVADQPWLFDLLHVYVWPALLVITAGALVTAWIHRLRSGEPGPAGPSPTRRLLGWTAGLAVLYFATLGWLESTVLLERGTSSVAATAGGLLAAAGLSATVSGSTVLTSHGSFLVTPGCIASPLIPLYLAAVITLLHGGRRLLGLTAAIPLFFILGVARLLVLALPTALLPAPQFAIHAFHQVLLGLALVVGAAFWWGPRRADPWGGVRRALLALAAGASVLVLVAPTWKAALAGSAAFLQSLAGHPGHTFADAQGAFSMLPSFDLVLFVCLCLALRETMSARRVAVGLGALAILQVGADLVAGELSHHLGFAPHVALVRAWGVVVPVTLVWILGQPLPGRSLRRPSSTSADDSRPLIPGPATTSRCGG